MSTESLTLVGAEASNSDNTSPLSKDRLTDASSTFSPNMVLPVHRWFRYSAGFSAKWVEDVIRQESSRKPRVFDPFVGSGTTLLAAEMAGAPSWGIDAHPFLARITLAKLQWRTSPALYREVIGRIIDRSRGIRAEIGSYPDLIRRCFEPEALATLDRLRRACIAIADESPAGQLAWLTLISTIRKVSWAGTAQWQYILPAKRKKNPVNPNRAFEDASQMFYDDLLLGSGLTSPRAQFALADARNCAPVPSKFANLVITSPPYPNNYDYADATRLEMCFLQEINGWGDLQDKVRRHLIVSCSQHVPPKSGVVKDLVTNPVLAPIADELREVCEELAVIREGKGGKKTYHLMVASYFLGLAQTWVALRRVCDTPSRICFVIGDSAPYGVYVPVIPWLIRLAEAAGFSTLRFEKTRDRNVKWKNRKHRVPLQEGRLWLEG